VFVCRGTIGVILIVGLSETDGTTDLVGNKEKKNNEK
jgi:hypothetical protein